MYSVQRAVPLHGDGPNETSLHGLRQVCNDTRCTSVHAHGTLSGRSLSNSDFSLGVCFCVCVSVSGSPCFVSIGVSIKLFFASCLSVSVDWDAKIVYATTILHMCICVRRHAVS